jgi:hypothetical protein
MVGERIVAAWRRGFRWLKAGKAKIRGGGFGSPMLKTAHVLDPSFLGISPVYFYLLFKEYLSVHPGSTKILHVAYPLFFERNLSSNLRTS